MVTGGRDRLVNICEVSPKIGHLPWGKRPTLEDPGFAWKKVDFKKINGDDDDDDIAMPSLYRSDSILLSQSANQILTETNSECLHSGESPVPTDDFHSYSNLKPDSSQPKCLKI